MIEEAKLIVAALRTSCEENGSCPDCPVNYWCHEKNGVRLEDAAADLIESLSAQLEQVTRERDAAVRDIEKSPITLCDVCAHYHKNFPCSGGNGTDKINITIACTMFKWRGAEVEHGI